MVFCLQKSFSKILNISYTKNNCPCSSVHCVYDFFPNAILSSRNPLTYSDTVTLTVSTLKQDQQGVIFPCLTTALMDFPVFILHCSSFFNLPDNATLCCLGLVKIFSFLYAQCTKNKLPCSLCQRCSETDVNDKQLRITSEFKQTLHAKLQTPGNLCLSSSAMWVIMKNTNT